MVSKIQLHKPEIHDSVFKLNIWDQTFSLVL